MVATGCAGAGPGVVGRGGQESRWFQVRGTTAAWFRMVGTTWNRLRRTTRPRPRSGHRYDGRMADPANPPGERRLAHPPSDRYVKPAADDVRPAKPGRSLAFGAIAALAGAATITVLGGVLTVTAGLVVIAAATGWAVGAVLPGRFRAAVALAVAAVALGQLGLWAYAQSEGGVLGPLDLLWQVYGGLVPLEFVAAAVLAWIGAR